MFIRGRDELVRAVLNAALGSRGAGVNRGKPDGQFVNLLFFNDFYEISLSFFGNGYASHKYCSLALMSAA